MADIRYKDIISSTGHWVWEVDASGTYTYCSEDVRNYLGYSAEEVVGKTPFDFMSETEALRVGNIFKDIVINKELIRDLENTHLNLNGEEVIVLTNAIPILSDDGSLLGYQGFDRDITTQKRLEQQIETKRLLLIQQSRYASMGEMIANISHQWKQPLNALGLVIQKIDLLFKSENINKNNFDKDISKCKNLILNMSETINAFRDFFNHNKDAEEFSVSEAINNAYSILEPEFKQTLINYQQEFKEDLVKAVGNKNELSQVIINLLNNAKDVLVEKEIENPTITVNIKQIPDQTIIEVCDNAGGVPPKCLECIFDPYYTTKDKNHGTGIGLYMSRMIIEETFNGKLTASNNHEGACFQIVI